jgi:transposase-like protein
MDPRRIKIHRSYTVEQLAQLLDCHKNTVRLWIKQGLEPLKDDKRPLMIQGSVARQFLEEKRRSKKRRCLPEELYCLSCHEPRLPANRRAIFQPSPGRAGLLEARCCTCGTRMFKCVSATALGALQSSLTLEIYETEETPKLAA